MKVPYRWIRRVRAAGAERGRRGRAPGERRGRGGLRHPAQAGGPGRGGGGRDRSDRARAGREPRAPPRAVPGEHGARAVQRRVRCPQHRARAAGAARPTGSGAARRARPTGSVASRPPRSVASNRRACCARSASWAWGRSTRRACWRSRPTPRWGRIWFPLGLDDHILEIEITPNRPDCLSVVGVARELSALTGVPFRPPAITVKESDDEPVTRLAKVRIDAPDLCHRFTARVISGVRVRPSPAWLATRLRAVGLRPINNVVDVTNYVMWELGHPLHAFDHARVSEGTIVVRRARPGERFTTLDGKERTLDESMLLIADPERAIGIAGVMGGANSEVGPETTRVLLESAYFLPASIHRTSRALGLVSDAAYRFARGADIEALVDASDRAAQLIAELGGGTVARGRVDVYPTPHVRPRIRLRMARVGRVLGTAPPREEAVRILSGLGLPVERSRRKICRSRCRASGAISAWRTTWWRRSSGSGVTTRSPSTLMTGILRPAQVPAGLRQPTPCAGRWWGRDSARSSRTCLAIPRTTRRCEPAPRPAPVALRNPLSRDASLLRGNPLDGVLGVVATNIRKQQPNVRIFEIGKVFEPGGECRASRAGWPSRWPAPACRPPGGPSRGPTAGPSWWTSTTPRASPSTCWTRSAWSRPRRASILSGGTKGFEPDCHGVLVAEGGITRRRVRRGRRRRAGTSRHRGPRVRGPGSARRGAEVRSSHGELPGAGPLSRPCSGTWPSWSMRCARSPRPRSRP